MLIFPSAPVRAAGSSCTHYRLHNSRALLTPQTVILAGGSSLQVCVGHGSASEPGDCVLNFGCPWRYPKGF